MKLLKSNLPMLQSNLTLSGRRKRTRGRKWMAIRSRILSANSVCVICRARPAAEVDHRVPLALGGSDDDGNLVACCRECHAAKTKAEAQLWPLA
jgi:5-methylcytosine-specific restriction protein A